jgi:hypothetical protein
MSTTYRAIQAIAPGKLLAVELAVTEPPPGYSPRPRRPTVE